MPGLMTQMGGRAEGRMQPTTSAEAKPGRPMMGAGAQRESDESTASPEEQKVYDQVVDNALKLIASPKTRDGIMASLRGDGDPKEGLAMTGATIAKRVFDSATQAGMKIPGDIMMAAGQEIVEALAQIQADAGIADLSEQEIEGAFYRGLDLFREMAQADGSLDTAALQQDFKAMAEANAQGRLGDVVPGADEAAMRFEKQPDDQETEEA